MVVVVVVVAAVWYGIMCGCSWCVEQFITEVRRRLVNNAVVFSCALKLCDVQPVNLPMSAV